MEEVKSIADRLSGLADEDRAASALAAMRSTLPLLMRDAK